MATTDAGGPSRSPQVPVDIDSSDASSVDSRDGPSWRSRVACPWRTPRFYNRECSRYFDCPSHVVERALSDTDAGPDEAQPRGRRQQEDTEGEEATGHPAPRDVSPLSEDDDGGEGHDSGSSTSREPSVASSPRANAGSGDRPRSPDSTAPEQPSSPSQSRAEAQTSQRSSGTAMSSRLSREHSNVGPPAVNTSTASPAPATRLISRPSPTVSPPTMSARTSEIVLPRWQPDSEVTYCPICGTQFSFFVRKHHCRKCGRVVCNACSPHRITIPHQYIVRPPGAPQPLSVGPSFSLLDNQGWYPEFAGGERVRLCNPCVPDPNTAPPQDRGDRPRLAMEPRSPTSPESAPLANRWGLYWGSEGANDAQTRSRSATMQPAASSSSRPPLPPHRVDEGRILWGTPPAYYRAASSSQTTNPYPGVGQRYRSMLDIGDRPGPSSAAGPSSSSAGASRRFHSPVIPRPQIAEEDECPVCHRELPPRTLPNFESLREAHINSCITSHSRYGGSAVTPPAGGDGDPDMLPSAPPRRTGMFPYTATEKDCVDSAECSICLEEFEVGVPMARLECLCRFHRACIRAWWERHPGRCPMHQHDGFGY